MFEMLNITNSDELNEPLPVSKLIDETEQFPNSL